MCVLCSVRRGSGADVRRDAAVEDGSAGAALPGSLYAPDQRRPRLRAQGVHTLLERIRDLPGEMQ